MSSKTRSIIATTCISLLACARAPAPTPVPTMAEIESAGIQAVHAQHPTALLALQKWATAGYPVAQRELAFAYATKPETHTQTRTWLEKAAKGGDTEAQFQLAEAYYKGRWGLKSDYQQAYNWYEIAANNKEGRASFMLARMSKYGQGTSQDLATSVRWLKTASEQGNAQAMFLLSNAYAAGEGTDKNPALARKWLEESAELEYPVAIQALAMELETGSQHVEKDAVKARHLIKEASDERLMRWNRYQ
ncbi:tetratricopeptide repeat protein [Undibacterium sp. TS12]|uniref:tetratricopeptide repeat protein n=1 Tax=Undibacterium sp. TS12 TaxID=2908202 RepID=UPI001F4CD47D|nr:tetratricopeptide repeat protein [Undibacterium sp. TS12]MCH8620604.1 sel1 repeat family protein [Undibacterium sp. TS12]